MDILAKILKVKNWKRFILLNEKVFRDRGSGLIMKKNRRKKNKNKMHPIVLAALVLIGGFFAIKIISFLGCLPSGMGAANCWHLSFFR